MLELFAELPEQLRPVRDVPGHLLATTTWRAPDRFPDLRGCKRIAIDRETRDEDLKTLGPGTRRPNCYVVGTAIATDRGEVCYLPTRHDGGGNLDAEKVRRWEVEELSKFDGEIVGANVLYDLEWYGVEGITFPNVKRFRDVLLAEAVLDEFQFRYSLETALQTRLGIGKDEALLDELAKVNRWKKASDKKKNLWRAHASYVGPYGEGDVRHLLRLLDTQEKLLEADGQNHVFDLECRLIPVLLAMRMRGVRIDLPRAEEVYRTLAHERASLVAKASTLAGCEIQLMAVSTIAPALRERGFMIPKTKPTTRAPDGNDSITGDWLKANAGDELVDLIRAARKVNTILTTFVGPLLERNVRGRIYGRFNQLRGSSESEDEGVGSKGTVTARFSSESPNLQNIPARDPRLGPMVRSIFLPEEGEDWAGPDLSQIEFRYLTQFAVGGGAEAAREAYRADPKTDFHVRAGDQLGADAGDEFVRKRVKNTNFAYVYGAGIDQLARTFGCSVEEAKRFMLTYDARLPFVKATRRAAADWAARYGTVVTILNRKMRFPLWEPARYGEWGRPLPRELALREYGTSIRRAMTKDGLSRKLQGSAAEQLKMAMVLAHEAGLTAEDALGAFLNTVHDELGSSAPRGQRGVELTRELKRTMETAIPNLRVPIVAEMKLGPSWGELRKVA